MTSFIHIEYSTEHPGVSRVESAIDAMRQLGRTFYSTRGLSTLLLASIVAAVMVVAYELMDSVTGGNLLALWMAMWTVIFVALAVFSRSARHVAVFLVNGANRLSRAFAKARVDWAMAGSNRERN
ncbi:MAG: hypothetical protein JWP96_1943 [Polaromonas sp.]|nr:hypothetical protein [Polaromonas sp.]